MTQMIFCRGCGKEIEQTLAACPKCGLQQGQPRPDPALKYIIPVGRSGWAIAAGYLGLFSILLIPAPVALFCGIMALRDISKNPGKLGKPRAIFGIVLGLTGTLLLLAIFMNG